MILLSTPPPWHTILFSILGTLAVIGLSIIGFFIVRWMNRTEKDRIIDREEALRARREDMEAIHSQRVEDMKELERVRMEDNGLMRGAIEQLSESIGSLAEETRKKALSDAKFETKVLLQVKDFQDKMLALSVDVGNHKKQISDIENEIRNIKKRHKINHGEEL